MNLDSKRGLHNKSDLNCPIDPGYRLKLKVDFGWLSM